MFGWFVLHRELQKMLNYLSDKQENMSDLFKEVIYKLKYQYQPKHFYIIFASF